MIFKIVKIPLVLFALLGFTVGLKAQCGPVISTFPYIEGFETAPAWTSGGTNSDWAWGTPSHSLINSAGGGNKSWCVGGLNGSFYNYGELSWLMSPCFDFTGLAYPWVSFKVFWESEWKYDGMVFQYSLNGGTAWTNVGAYGDPVNCLNDNWYNYNSVTGLSSANPKHGWTGRVGPTTGSCQGGNGSGSWLTAKHCMSSLAGKPSVRFRFLFGAGTTCNSYNGIAIDDILIQNAAPNIADFTYLCTDSNSVNFTNTSSLCPTTFSWNFGDIGSGTSNTSTLQHPSHIFSESGTYAVTLSSSGPCNAAGSVSIPITILSLNSTATNVTCNGPGSGTATAHVNGGTGTLAYLWTPGGGTTQTIAGLDAETYSVTVSGTGCCPTNTTVTVLADTCPNDSICIPNVFSPNSDGINDVFFIYNKGYKSLQCQIYDRWGLLVGELKKLNDVWDGRTTAGLKCPDGVYFFILKAEKLNDIPVNYTGFIHLLDEK